MNKSDLISTAPLMHPVTSISVHDTKEGHMIHSKCSNGEEEWTEYDDQGRVVHYKDSKGYERPVHLG